MLVSVVAMIAAQPRLLCAPLEMPVLAVSMFAAELMLAQVLSVDDHLDSLLPANLMHNGLCVSTIAALSVRLPSDVYLLL